MNNLDSPNIRTLLSKSPQLVQMPTKKKVLLCRIEIKYNQSITLAIVFRKNYRFEVNVTKYFEQI